MPYSPPNTQLGDIPGRAGAILNQVNGVSDSIEHTAILNREQWERETEYNSPKEQMKRLREAGLNPDMIYGQGAGAANTASSAQLTSGTPQSRGVLNGISSFLNAASEMSLLESQKEKNIADANRANAQAGEHEVNTKFKLRTFDDACRKIWLDGKFTESQIKNAEAMNEQIQMKTFEISKNIDLMGDYQDILSADKVIKWHTARITGHQADYWFEQSKHAGEYFDNLVGNLESEMKVNTAYANLLRGQYRLLNSTFSAQVNLQRNLSNYYANLAGVQKQLIDLNRVNVQSAKANLEYIPYMYANAMYQSELVYEHDKDGNIVFDDKGLPKVNATYVNYQRFMGNLNQGLDALESLSNTFKNIGVGVGGFKVGGFNNFPSPSGNSNSFDDGLDYNQLIESYRKDQWNKKYQKLYH